MPNLQTTIATLAHNFATDLIAALRAQPLAEILAQSSSGSAKRTAAAKPSTKAAPAARKGSAPKGAVNVDAIVAILRNHKGGLKSGELRRQLGAPEYTFNYHITKALSAKQIVRKGQRRATTYFVR